MSEAAAMAGFAVRLAMAAIFLIAALHALRRHDAYAAVVQAYRILPEPLAAAAALLLPPLEIAIAATLVLPKTHGFGSLAALAMLACFTAAMLTNLLRGRRDIACGCGGGAGQKISWPLVLRNVLLVCALAASLAAPDQIPPAASAIIGIAGLSGFLAALYFAANQLMVNIQYSPRAGARS